MSKRNERRAKKRAAKHAVMNVMPYEQWKSNLRSTVEEVLADYAERYMRELEEEKSKPAVQTGVDTDGDDYSFLFDDDKFDEEFPLVDMPKAEPKCKSEEPDDDCIFIDFDEAMEIVEPMTVYRREYHKIKTAYEHEESCISVARMFRPVFESIGREITGINDLTTRMACRKALQGISMAWWNEKYKGYYDNLSKYFVDDINEAMHARSGHYNPEWIEDSLRLLDEVIELNHL